MDDRLFEWMRDIRRTIHQQPELSFQEHDTSLYIQKKLKELSIPFVSGWGGTGVVGTLGGGECGGGADHHVGLRADMDALPVKELNHIDYASKNPGVMHACGHDGHVAMLLGAAALLSKINPCGRISLIFQPAEEYGNGAHKIIEEGALDDSLQAVFAGHIDTHYDTGTITVDEGIICSFADPFRITLKGSSGHAARPHETRDAIVAGCYLVTALQTIVSRETDPNRAGVVSVGCFNGGSGHNIIGDTAVLEGTVRSSHPQVRSDILDGINRVMDSIGKLFRVDAKLDFLPGLPAVINSKTATDVARAAAVAVVGHEGVISQGQPSLGAEDFSFYQQIADGCMVRFGASPGAEASPAHCGTFNFDEKVLAVGASWLATVALRWLGEYGEHSP